MAKEKKWHGKLLGMIETKGFVGPWSRPATQ